MRSKIVKPGRYICIGRLHLPITDEHKHVECYKIGPAARKERAQICHNHGFKRMSKFGRIWAHLMKER